jgi:hypothetical protein
MADDKNLAVPSSTMWERRASALDHTAVSSALEGYRMENKERRPTLAEIQDRVREGSVVSLV